MRPSAARLGPALGWLLALSISAMLLGAVACGDDEGRADAVTVVSTTAAPAVDPCALLSANEVAGATGLQTRSGMFDAAAEPPVCVWEVGDTGSNQTVVLRLVSGQTPPADAERIALGSNVGYWDRQAEYLAVARGEQGFHVKVKTRQSPAERQAIATELAGIVLSRLPAD